MADIIIRNEFLSKVQDTNLQKDVKKIKQNILKKNKDNKKNQKLKLNIVFRIIDIQQDENYCIVNILGLENIPFLITSQFLAKQSVNMVFIAQDMVYDQQKNYLYLEPTTKLKPFFMGKENFNQACQNQIGNISNPLHNFNVVGFYKDHCLDYQQLFVKDPQSQQIQITGVIKKINKFKGTLIVKTIDIENLIDTCKIFINFKNEQDYKKIQELLKPNQIVKFKSSLERKMSKKLSIIFSFKYDQTSEIQIIDKIGVDLSKTKTCDRIKTNPKKAILKTTDLVDLSPFTFHRGIHCLLAQPLNIFHCTMQLFCRICKHKTSDCKCEQESECELDVFCMALFKNSQIRFTSMIKRQSDFFDLFDIDQQQQDFIFDYLKQNNGNFKYTMNEYVDFSSDKSIIVLRILQKIFSYKLIFGRFVAKEDNYGQKSVKELSKIKKGKIFPNGRIKSYNDLITHNFDFKIKYVDNDQKNVQEKLKEKILSHLLI